MKLKNIDIISQLSLEEKASLCSGADFWHTKAIERLGIPAIMMTDGPHGLRKQEASQVSNVHASVPATCFPTASAIAASWDKNLAKTVGEAIAEEAAAEQVSIVLGPGTNIKRSPLCGRNFEYFSEDPCLAGDIAAAFISGLQSNGTACSLKHFAANNQESARMTVSAEIDERTLNELYLAPFRRAVTKANPATLMCSYNKINGVYSSENPLILQDKLRKEWGFKGAVMTDWGAVCDRAKGVKSGLDLEMPGSGGINDKKIVEAVKNGTIDESDVDKAVDNLLTLILNAKATLEKHKGKTYDKINHDELSAQISSQCSVLLKNNGAFPLNKNKKVLLVGEMAENMRFQGAGSSHINANKITNFVQGFTEVGGQFAYMKGYDGNSLSKSNKLTAAAVKAAANYDDIVVVGGLTDKYEAEGYDRTTLDMPIEQNKLIEALCQSGKRISVLLCCGAPITMPWIDKVNAVLLCYLGGQSAGRAAASLVYGDVNPSGKLAETFPLSLGDIPASANFPANPAYCNYAESIYVGYRYFNTTATKTLFPFGYGLSYTTFEYSGITATCDDKELTVSFTIKNTGKTDGAEVAQLYVSENNPTTFRPKRELKGFEKVFLKKGESKQITIKVDIEELGFYNTKVHKFYTPSGNYTAEIGCSCEDIKLTAEFSLTTPKQDIDKIDASLWYFNPNSALVPDKDFEQLLGRPLNKDYTVTPKGQYTIRSTFYDMSQTSGLARFIIRVAGFGIRRGMHCKKNDPAYKMILETFKSTPLINVTFTTQGAISEDRVKAIVFMMNKHLMRGFWRFVFNRPDKK